MVEISEIGGEAWGEAELFRGEGGLDEVVGGVDSGEVVGELFLVAFNTLPDLDFRVVENIFERLPVFLKRFDLFLDFFH